MWITRMTGYYNLGTTTYYNVPYREHAQSRDVPYKTHYVKQYLDKT